MNRLIRIASLPLAFTAAVALADQDGAKELPEPTEREQEGQSTVDPDERADPVFGDHPKREGHRRVEGAPQAGRGSLVKLSTSLRGVPVLNAENDEFGSVDDVVVDVRNGRVAAVLISPDTAFWERDGGVLAVAPQSFTVLGGDRLLLSLTNRDLRQAKRISARELIRETRQLAASDSDELRSRPPVFRLEEEDDDTVFAAPDRDNDR